jgi:hypothetical protein
VIPVPNLRAEPAQLCAAQEWGLRGRRLHAEGGGALSRHIAFSAYSKELQSTGARPEALSHQHVLLSSTKAGWDQAESSGIPKSVRIWFNLPAG